MTLNGQVEWEYLRRAAEVAVRSPFGCIGVTNRNRYREDEVHTADIEEWTAPRVANVGEQPARRGLTMRIVLVTVEIARI